MTPAKSISLGLLTSIFLSGAISLADGLAMQVRDWSLSDSDVCTISTTTKKGVLRVERYTLQISKAKNKADSPVEVTVSLDKNVRDSKSMMVSLPSLSAEMPLPILKVEDATTFWGIAKHVTALISDLKANGSLDARGVGGSAGDVSLKFSADGFSEVLAEMEKRCNKGASLAYSEFELFFLSGASNSLDPLKLSQDVVAQLRSLYFQAFPMFQQLKEAQAGLSAVLAKYQVSIDEQARVRSELTHIQSIDLPQSKASLAAAIKQQADAKADIARLTALIPSLQSQVQSTQKIYDAAEAILAPLEPEHDRLVQILGNAQNVLRAANARLAVIDSRLQTLASELSSMRSESSNLQQATSQERFQLSNAQNDLSIAQSRRANFNVQFERDQRLRNNSEYTRAISDRSSLTSQLQDAQQRLNQTQGERARVAQALAQCRNVPAGSPPPDCSRFEQALSNADSQIAELQTAVRQNQSRINDLNSRISSIEQQVSQQVQSEYNVLVNRETECRQRVAQIEDQLQRDQNRLSQLINSEIPNREREQSQLNTERPQVLARISQGNVDLSNASNQLASFRAANDWDRKEAAVNQAANNLSDAQDALATAQAQKAAAEKSLQSGIAAEASLRAKISSLEARAVVLAQRDAELVKILEPLPAERAPFDAKIASLTSSITSLRDRFSKLIPQ